VRRERKAIFFSYRMKQGQRIGAWLMPCVGDRTVKDSMVEDFFLF
jgi:hypothetical protein